MHDFFDLYKKCYNNGCCICKYGEDNIIQSKIINSYFNVEYIKFFYLLQKNIDQIVSNKNMSILINMNTNIYNNSNILCNEIVENKMYELYELYYNFSRYNKGQIVYHY